jgi:hypothetical protein
MLKVLSNWVKLETSQLSTGEGVAEYCVYFASQHHRAWPWRFMRPHHSRLLAPPAETNKKFTTTVPPAEDAAAAAAAYGQAVANGTHPHQDERGLVGVHSRGRHVPGDNLSSGDEVNVTVVTPGVTTVTPEGGAAALPTAAAAAAEGGGLGALPSGGELDMGAAVLPLRGLGREEGTVSRFSSESFNQWVHTSGSAADGGGRGSCSRGSRAAGRVISFDTGTADEQLQASGSSIELQPAATQQQHQQQQVDQEPVGLNAQEPSSSPGGGKDTAAAAGAGAAEAAGAPAGSTTTRRQPRRSRSWSAVFGKKQRGNKVEFALESSRSASVRNGKAYQPDTKDQNPTTHPQGVTRHNRSRSSPWVGDDAASSKGQELLCELGHQVGATGGLHTSKRRRRKSQRYREMMGTEPGTRVELEPPNVCFALTPGAALAATTVASSCHSPRLGARGGQSVYSGTSGSSFARLLYAAGPGKDEELHGGMGGVTAVGGDGDRGDGGLEDGLGIDGDPAGLSLLKKAASTPVTGLTSTVLSTRPAMPLVAPLPNQQTLVSLRMTGAASSRGAASVHGTEISAAGFEGTDIGQTCSALMCGSWLWARQLLVHDLGTFK